MWNQKGEKQMESRKGKTETTSGTCTETHADGVRNFFASCPGIWSVNGYGTVITSVIVLRNMWRAYFPFERCFAWPFFLFDFQTLVPLKAEMYANWSNCYWWVLLICRAGMVKIYDSVTMSAIVHNSSQSFSVINLAFIEFLDPY